MAIENQGEPFVWGGGGKRRTPGQITRDEALAIALMKNGVDTSPVQHWTQGAARVASALAGVIRERRAESAALNNANASAANITAMLSGMNQPTPSGSSVIPAPQVNEPASPFPATADTVRPAQPFQPPVQVEASPFMKQEGSVTPEQSFTPTAAAQPQNVMELSPQDINRLRKLVLTEAVHGLPDEVYNQQVGGIVDTALNRVRSGLWGKDLVSVLNAPYQFSDINGPVSWKRGRKGVDEIPDAWLDTPNGKRVAAALDAHLAARANTPPMIGGHLNYANPHFSDASNLPWITKLDGPKLGAGNAVHWHGTAGNNKPVDANYFLRVAGAQQQAPAAAPQSPAEAAPQMQPFQVAALDPAELPTQMLAHQPETPGEAQQPQQVAQAPFSMSDVNAGNEMLAQRAPVQHAARQPVAPPPQQQAPQRPAIDPRIVQSLTSPYASPQEKMIAMKLLEPHIAPPQHQVTPLPNGMVLRKDPRSGRVEIVNPYSGQVVTDPQQIPQGLRNTKFGLTPQWGVKDGKPVMLQLGDDGSVKVQGAPDGVDLSPGIDRVDAGTHWVLTDKRSGQVVGTIPKDVRGAEKEKQIGKGEGQTIANQPKAEEQKRIAGIQAGIVVQDIDRALKMMETATLPTTGVGGSVLRNVPGTAAHDISNLMNTIKSNAAFDKLQAMRAASPTGGALGSVSDKENLLLQSAIGSLEQSQSREQLIENLGRVKELYLDIIHGRGNRPQAETPPAAAPQTTPKVRRFNPATGRLEDVQ